MGNRRHHLKSRKGCSQCRSRHIKCDERHPTCSSCTRRQIECDFTRKGSPVATPTRQPAVSPSLPNGPDRLYPVSINPPNPAHQGFMTDLTILDLELLHHFTTDTPMGLAHKEMWQMQVVQLAFSHDFLIRIILAVSALHLGVLRPSYRANYAMRASYHQGIALQSVTEVLNRGVDEANCHAVFAFSCIMVPVVLASSCSADPTNVKAAQNDIVEILENLQLARGCNAIVQPQWQYLTSGPLAPLLREGMYNEITPLHEVPGCAEITSLLRLCSNPKVSEDREITNAYYLAIHELLKSYAQLALLKSRDMDTVTATFIWPVAVPQKYLALLDERAPEAMIILAYYGILLHGIDDRWFMRGRAKCLISTVEKSIGDEWSHWLRYPKEKIK